MSVDGAGDGRVASAFETARSRGWRSALIPFVCAGDPDLGATASCLRRFPEAGASIVEVGIPFSDPIADGPTIAGAMHRALASGVRVTDVLETVRRARADSSCAYVAMVSCSIAQRYGPGVFAGMLAGAGFDGVIYPDLPLEEAEAFAGPARASGLTVSLLVSPATPAGRAERIARASDGFVYAMARRGITGESSGEGGGTSEVSSYLRRLRDASRTPVGCGFGISTPAEVRAIAAEADGVIVGSAIVRAMRASHQSGGDAVESAAELVGLLAEAAHG